VAFFSLAKTQRCQVFIFPLSKSLPLCALYLLLYLNNLSIYSFILETSALAPIEVEILLCGPEASGLHKRLERIAGIAP
jgi:hypothetical protein